MPKIKIPLKIFSIQGMLFHAELSGAVQAEKSRRLRALFLNDIPPALTFLRAEAAVEADLGMRYIDDEAASGPPAFWLGRAAGEFSSRVPLSLEGVESEIKTAEVFDPSTFHASAGVDGLGFKAWVRVVCGLRSLHQTIHGVRFRWAATACLPPPGTASNPRGVCERYIEFLGPLLELLRSPPGFEARFHPDRLMGLEFPVRHFRRYPLRKSVSCASPVIRDRASLDVEVAWAQAALPQHLGMPSTLIKKASHPRPKAVHWERVWRPSIPNWKHQSRKRHAWE